MRSKTNTQGEGYEGFTERACTLGAQAAVIIPATALVVEDRFAALCAEPHRCPNYGLAPGCPPHAMKPAVFRDILRSYHQVLVFKIDAPVAVLMGPERLDIARAIHRIAATIEQEALDRCLFLAKGVAAGSCKELFCSQEKGCVVLEKMQPCLHADRARPSLSALGVNFALLAQTAGWKFEKIEEKATSNGEPAMGLMAGMVLLD